MRHNGSPADYCLRMFDGEFLDETEFPGGTFIVPANRFMRGGHCSARPREKSDTDRHDPQLHWLAPALIVFAVAALVWMVLTK